MPPTRSVHRILALLFCSLGSGCGGPVPCARNAACAQGVVCRPDGTCGPLVADAVVRAAHGTRLPVSGLAVVGDQARTDLGDALLLGQGGGAVRFAFDGLPADGDPVLAELVLVPSPSRGDVATDARVIVDVLESLGAGDILVREAAVRRIPRGTPRLARIDVTDIARAARAGDRRTLVLAVRVEGGPLVVGSPRAASDARRPHLDILVPQ